jgi:hypothetical protein
MGTGRLLFSTAHHLADRRRASRFVGVVSLVLALAVVPVPAAAAGDADRDRTAGDPTVIADWNATAMSTEIADSSKLAPDVLISPDSCKPPCTTR